MGWLNNFKKKVIHSAFDSGLIDGETALRWSDEEKARTNRLPSESIIVNRFMSQIDAILGEDYLQYECVSKLRRETREQLRNAYRESPQELINFSNGIDHRLWALKQLNHLTFEEIGTGRHHLRDVLKPDGRILASVNRMCLQKHYIIDI